MEYIKIKMKVADYSRLYNEGLLPDHETLDVEVKDDFFENDQTYKDLKKASNKAYTELKKYEFKKRNP